ncbi:MAG: master DNA invertase Mpi family serine-type recombinase, partial [Alphaproteobacteria bacterium]|nr:master DNA invertase Mpi family serine-type recombinase [Alphaproteobacteria bacterium]
MIYAYIRISTEKQIQENQEFEINNFCNTQKLLVDKWVKETISGTKDFKKRKLGKVLNRLKPGDILICTEISRLGRNLLQVMTILNICMQKDVQVWTIKDNYRLGADIQSKVLAFAFSLSAEIERNLISQRTKEALARIKASGRTLGRKIGSRNKKHILDGREEQLLDLINKKIAKTHIAKLMGISIFTIYQFLKKKHLTSP